MYYVDLYSVHSRPYNDENTASRSLSEVKHRLAQLVLRWGTTLESWVLTFCHFLMNNDTTIEQYFESIVIYCTISPQRKKISLFSWSFETPWGIREIIITFITMVW